MSTHRQKLLENFKEEYAKLNENQRLAVDQIEGPVMVIAGPGTGKTQILAARIGKILLETDASPASILCLTYTDAGALAMRRRLLQFIGSDAYKVHIHTFHAFCNQLIQENLSYFDKPDLTPISDLERMEVLKELIDKLSKDSPLKRFRQDAYYDINNLSSLFSNIKKEGWTLEYLHKAIDRYLDELPGRPEYIYQKVSGANKKGDLKQNKIDEENGRMNKLRAAIDQFPVYQQMMREKQLYDFDDMINWVLKAFNDHPSLLQDYQERFQYLLVDEFQDTSGSQNNLVLQLINYWDKPNVFVVGDDDQSIYRFQGANIENMELFADAYAKDLTTIVLTNNYRSTQPILDISKSLISKNKERLINRRSSLTKELLASHPEISKLSDIPTILIYENNFQEKVGLTLQVEQLIANGVEPGNICIIARDNAFLGELAEIFRVRGIPAFTKRSMNLLHVPFTENIINILRYIVAEHSRPFSGEELLFKILHTEFFALSPLMVAKLCAEVTESNMRRDKPNLTLRELIAQKVSSSQPDLFSSQNDEKLRQASLALEKLIGDLPNTTLQGLLDNIVRDAGVLSAIMNSPEKFWRLQLLTALYDFIKNETRRNPALSAKEFIELLDLMIQNKIALPVVQVLGTEKGVNLLTAHGSKGLEFEYVYLSGCHSLAWEKKKGPNAGFKLPDTIFSSLPKSAEEEEMRRLFYVALTRAQKKLFITYAGCADNGKEQEPSQFISEILDLHTLPAQQEKFPKEIRAEFSLIQLEKSASPELHNMDEDFVDRALSRFIMNVTALNNFLSCPIKFFYNTLIRVPSSKNENMAFGSAIHFALQRLFEKMKSDPGKEFPSVTDLIADFEWNMQRNRECFVPEAFMRRMEYGRELLTNYYEANRNSWHKIVEIEYRIGQVVADGVPLKGALDKIEIFGDELNVVDYKTGSYKNAKAKLKGPDDKNPLGGDYWRQGVFYKILAENFNPRWTVLSTDFDFLEPDEKKQLVRQKVVIRPEDPEIVLSQIKDSWEKIQAKEFYTGCGKDDCSYCQLIKSNKLYSKLHSTDDEEAMEEEPLNLNHI